MTRWAIYHASREFAREQGDPLLGVVQADSKEQAEELAAREGEIVRRAYPGAGLWAGAAQGRRAARADAVTAAHGWTLHPARQDRYA